MPSPFELGFERGAAWARRNEGLEKPHPDSWAEVLIRDLGVEAVAGLFGTQPGGPSWTECCREYNVGCDAGVRMCRHETGPEKLDRKCAKEAVGIVTVSGSYLQQGLIVICREEDGMTTWVNSGSLNRHGSIEALTANLGEDVYTVIEGHLSRGLTEGKVMGKHGVYTWSLELP